MREGKQYLLTLAGALLAAAGVISSVNYVIDPYWQFNFAPKQQVIGLNHQVAQSALDRDFSTLMIARQKAMLASSHASTAVIGSSRSLYGIDSCAYSNVQKLGVYGINSKESLWLLEETLATNSIKRLFIEVGALVVESQSPANTFIEPKGGIVSTQLFITSLMSFATSWQQKELRTTFCAIDFPSKANFAEVANVAHQDNIYAEYLTPELPEKLQAAIKRFAQVCKGGQRTASNPLQVGLVMAPIRNENFAYSQIVAVEKLIQQMLTSESQTQTLNNGIVDIGSCQVTINVFENKPVYQQREHWFDTNHYKPSIGKLFWNELIHSESGKPRN